MRKKKCKNMTVFVGSHSSMFKNYLSRWLDAHPRTSWYRSGAGVDHAECVTMSESAWRRFCADYGLNFHALYD